MRIPHSFVAFLWKWRIPHSFVASSQANWDSQSCKISIFQSPSFRISRESIIFTVITFVPFLDKRAHIRIRCIMDIHNNDLSILQFVSLIDIIVTSFSTIASVSFPLVFFDLSVTLQLSSFYSLLSSHARERRDCGRMEGEGERGGREGT